MKLFKTVSFSLVAFAFALFATFAPSTSQAEPANKTIILATTTSTQDSGLLGRSDSDV